MSTASSTQHGPVRQGPVLSDPVPVDLGLTVHRPPRLPSPEPRELLHRYRRYAMLADAGSAVVAGVAAALLRFGLEPLPRYIVFSALVPLLWMAIVAAQRGYEYRFLGAGVEEYRRLVDAGLLLFITIAVASYALRGDVARGYVLIEVSVTVLLSLLLRRPVRRWLHGLRRDGRGLQRVLVVGRADAAVGVIEQLDREPEHGLVVVGACVLDSGVRVPLLRDVPVVGDAGQVLTAVGQVGAHVVAVVSHPDLSGHTLRRLSWELEERGVELVVAPGIVEVAGPRLSIRPIAGLSLLHLNSPPPRGGRMVLKSAFDRVLAGTMLLLALPLLTAIAVAIKVTSPGPVIFRQTRVGAEGTEFTMWKFRSMVVDAELRREQLRERDEGNGLLFKVRRDPRITRVGTVLRRFSLDELPQLVNVLRGDMSLVGPRPPLPEEVAAYCQDGSRRLRVRPGMTGLWQVSGRSDLPQEESLRLDLRYVDNWSLAFDLSILWRTVRAVLLGTGAY